MAARAAIATGSATNFTTAGTWGLIDATGFTWGENAAIVLPTSFGSSARSAAQTPGAITVDGIGVKLNVRTGTTGTISVHIALNSDHSEVAGTLVTFNVSDLPAAVAADLNGGWIYFKFASPVLLLAATAYEVEAKTSTASQVSLWRTDATAGNIAVYLRTTTTGAPAAGDDLIITKEFINTTTSTAAVVTMDNTATTDFGSAPTAANSLLLPGVSVCNGGTLIYGTTGGVNYYLKESNSLIVYAGGTFNIGTVATAIPRNSTAVLEFDPANDGDYGLIIRNLGTFTSQGLSRTIAKTAVSCLLNVNALVNDTTLNVDTDTGWLDNDVIVVASTTTQYQQTEKGTLNGNAGATSMTVDGFAGIGGGLANAHSGTNPAQAEIILLTRNVMIRSATSTIMAYVDFKPTSTVDMDWTEIYYVGEDASNKRGITIETTTGTCTISYCSVHDTEDYGISTQGANVNNITVEYCNLSNCASVTTPCISVGAATTATTTVIFDHNIVMFSAKSSQIGIYTNDNGITITNNTVCGINGNGYSLAESAAIGNFTGNSAHSLPNPVFSNFTNGTTGTITGGYYWRVNGNNLTITTGNGLIFSGVTIFGAGVNNQNISIIGGICTTFINCTIAADTSNATKYGLSIGSVSALAEVRFYNCTFGVATGIFTAHGTADIFVANAGTRIFLNNCNLATTVEVSGQATLLSDPDACIFSSKNDQTTGANLMFKTWKTYGTITLDTAANMFRTASPSERLDPNNASNKLESGSFKVNVNSGQTCTPSVYVRESVVGDGEDYNGNRARLILKRNDAIGVTADVVIDTATISSEGAFEQLTGTTAAASENGVMEFVVDCDGTTGWVNVDDITATVA